MKGGLPIEADGIVVGGIGVSSGTGDQDREVAEAALASAALSGTTDAGHDHRH